MSQPKIAAQLYTLRDFLKTPEQIQETFKKVKQIGYSAVQVSGVGVIDQEKAKVIKDAAKENQLNICATHISYEQLQNQMDWVIDFHNMWDCTYVGLGAMPEQYRNEEGYHFFAKEASKIGKILKEHDLSFIYHNHAFEFEKYNGKTGMDILLKESDPATFHFELDTYWVQAGGADPVEWINKVKGRMPVVHFKDMGIHEGKQVMMEIGQGNLNWRKIIPACQEIGVEWAAVEQDICLRSPFKSLEMSLSYLKELGL